MKIYTKYHTKNACYITGQRGTTRKIVVHSTGANNPYLNRYVDDKEHVGPNRYGNHWNQNPVPPNRQCCVHAFIGRSSVEGAGEGAYNTCVEQILPYDYCAWGVGGKGKFGDKVSYNYSPKAIQFEICEDGLADLNYFKEVFRLAQEYCATLCKQFGLNPLTDIVSHRECYERGCGSSAHIDPHNWFDAINKRFSTNYTMDWFRHQVADILNSMQVTAPGTTSNVAKPKATITEKFLVKVCNPPVAIYKTASVNGAVTGYIRNKGVFTIIQTENNMGKLKSGAGWIHIDNSSVVRLS